jgi:2-amino-4-hydroxy-6-hydroxymethyldihydropteridine diphosphokinase
VIRRAFLGLGANMGDRQKHLRRAIELLREAKGVNFLRASRVYETEPIGVVDQPRFLNMVVEVEVEDEVKTRDLLRLVKRIEEGVGRTRRERWGPREIDIDVLLVEGERVEEEDFAVPHPRMWERAFVVVPLAELEPGLKGPGGETAERIAERLRERQRIYANVHL